MADLTSLVAGGAKSLLKDKAAEFMSPQQMELARFALSPQAYLADKGITAVAELLGYGNQFKELKAGAQDEKDYYKETMRDALGNVLPNAIGDFVRATPRNTEIDNTPAGTYTAWNPETQSFEEQQSSAPVATFDPFASARFDAKVNPDSPYNTNSQNYVGPATPKDMNSSIYSSNLTDLLSMLGKYEAPEVPEMAINADKASFEEGDTFDADLGMNVPSNTGGGKLEELLQAQDNYKRGGQICGCKH